MYQDMRAPFRHGGDAAIIPPIPEKEIPEWLKPIWNEAEETLRSADTWVICGYSLPEYDKEVLSLLSAAATGACQRVFLIDPGSAHLLGRWRGLAPNAEVLALPGLPGAIQLLEQGL
jgi:hypothetical protein